MEYINQNILCNHVFAQRLVVLRYINAMGTNLRRSALMNELTKKWVKKRLHEFREKDWVHK